MLDEGIWVSPRIFFLRSNQNYQVNRVHWGELEYEEEEEEEVRPTCLLECRVDMLVCLVGASSAHPCRL